MKTQFTNLIINVNCTIIFLINLVLIIELIKKMRMNYKTASINLVINVKLQLIFVQIITLLMH